MAIQLQQGLFLVFAGIAVTAGLAVIFNRNAVHSALALLVNFASLAAFYLLLNAQFIAVVQVIVYAGAIVVLFLFVVMLLGAGGETRAETESWLNWRTALIVGAAVVLLTVIGTAVFEGAIGGASGTVTPEQIAEAGQIQVLGAALFTDYLLPFELSSVLLLVGILGAVVLGHRWRETSGKSEQKE
jgi:NADH-quinone oxidoreductase subunit J